MGTDTINIGSLQISQDRKLAQQILAGDEQAFNRFVDIYFPRLYRYTRYRLVNEGDVDDVVQAVLSQAARRLETYRGEATLLTWLIQICRHEISRNLQKAKRQADLMTPFLNDDLLRSVVESIETTPEDNPEQRQHRYELITLIQFALDQLPERHARVLELKYIEGFSSLEIAKQLKTSDEATQSLLARARKAFKEVCGDALRNWYKNEGHETPPIAR